MDLISIQESKISNPIRLHDHQQHHGQYLELFGIQGCCIKREHVNIGNHPHIRHHKRPQPDTIMESVLDKKMGCHGLRVRIEKNPKVKLRDHEFHQRAVEPCELANNHHCHNHHGHITKRVPT